MTTLQKIHVIRMVLVNLVPIIGILFFEWDPFWIALAYVIETLAIYIVYEIDVYFIDRHSRYPLIIALLQFPFTMLPFLGIMTGTVYLIYWTIKEPTSQSGDLTDGVEKYLYDEQVPYLLGCMLLIEFVTYYIKKANRQNNQERDIWRIFWRIIYLNFYLVIAMFILSIIPGNAVVYSFFLIGIKVVLDYSQGQKDFYQNLGKWFQNSAVGKWFTSSPKHPLEYRELPPERPDVKQRKSKNQ